MINYKLDRVVGVIRTIDVLEIELRIAQMAAGYAGHSGIPVAADSIDDALRQRVQDIITLADSEASDLEFDATKHRMSLVKLRLPKIQRRSLLVQELLVLRETLEGDLKTRFFYAYPPDKAKIADNFDHDWRQTNIRFKAAAADARSGVDCYAVGHNLACVFHLMRVMEIGVQQFEKS
jgi:hypothetical protein